MTTELSSGQIPAVYRDVFEVCSNNGEPIHPEVYQLLLSQCKLDQSSLRSICSLTGAKGGEVSRTMFYKTLALVAWVQQGKPISEKSLENYLGVGEFPIPQLSDLNPVRSLKLKLHARNPSDLLGLTYSEITGLDSLSVELVPEKKGLFLKHSEYFVTSRRFDSKVTRRYNDFIAFYELLLGRFPYRIVPRLPPKKIVSDANFLEARRRGLHRWLTLVCRHPTVCQDHMVVFFLTEQTPDMQYKLREIFRRAPDEFMTSDYAATAKNHLPSDCTVFASNREQVRLLVQIIGKIKYLVDSEVERSAAHARDADDLTTQLKALSCSSVNIGVGLGVGGTTWSQMQKGFAAIAHSLPAHAQHATKLELTVCERLGLLLDVLVAHRDLCERLEKGLTHDHQSALQKMLSLKKRKIQGVIRGTDAESVEQLEAKMLAQENVISNMEMRSDFSLYCVHMETQLVYAYLETLSAIMRSLVALRIRAHTELTESWQQVLPLVEKYLPENSSPSSANGPQN